MTQKLIGGTGSISDELAAANQSIHDCFWYYNGHGLTNLQPIKNTCENLGHYAGLNHNGARRAGCHLFECCEPRTFY